MAKRTGDLAKQFSTKVQEAGNLKSVAPGAQSGFRELFQVRPLDEEEGRAIELLLVDNFQPGRGVESQVEGDVQSLKNITAEIRAIGRQGVYLLGERIRRAQDLLKQYSERTFSKWLDLAFGNRRTPYTYLHYFELHESLPSEELKSQLRKFPLKAAYVLAERNGELGSKIDLLEKYAGETQQDLLLLIRDRFPLDTDDKRVRQTANQRIIFKMEWAIDVLLSRKGQLTGEELRALSNLYQKMEQFQELS